ncbi:hypothetical protein [Nocardiopsis halotolerans]|uniref:hypothetical protein n=1 Tax=Nocardiopsis halotolerans TaxID=124252 RepID=UPI00034AB5EA|nr:hypothetical protein [Nocardiopsis halotolerans]
MSFKNIFGIGGNEARDAEEASRNVYGKIPGVRPEREGVDPELYDGIPPAEPDPKIIRETSPEALAIMNTFVTPLFGNTRTVAAEQRKTSEDPGSTSGMASSAKDRAFTTVRVGIRDEDRPEIREEDRPGSSDEEREAMMRENQDAYRKFKTTSGWSTEP